MNRFLVTYLPLPLLSLSLTLVAFSLHAAEPQEESDIAAALKKAKARVTEEDKYTLRYKYTRGEILRWKVVHLATTETQIQGNSQSSRSRATSVKVWTVTDVDGDGNITISHSVASVDMWQKVTDRPEIRYNSETDTEVPPEYQHVANTLSRPLTSITIRPDGTTVERESESREFKFGVGNMVMRLPEQAIEAGTRWSEPSESRIRLPDGRFKRVKLRKLYTLEKVETGVASISVKTEVLTPVSDPKVQSGLMQQLTDGTIKFDVDAGRVLTRQMDWDETIIGFNGADSMLKYLARFTEELLPPDTNTARRETKSDTSATR